MLKIKRHHIKTFSYCEKPAWNLVGPTLQAMELTEGEQACSSIPVPCGSLQPLCRYILPSFLDLYVFIGREMCGFETVQKKQTVGEAKLESNIHTTAPALQPCSCLEEVRDKM